MKAKWELLWSNKYVANDFEIVLKSLKRPFQTKERVLPEQVANEIVYKWNSFHNDYKAFQSHVH